MPQSTPSPSFLLLARLRRLRLMVLLGLALLVFTPGTPRAGTVLRVGFVPVVGVGQIFVITGEGWDKAAGLDLKLTQFDSGPAMISALASGTLDVYYGGIGALMVAMGRGIGSRVLASTAINEVSLVARGALALAAGQAESTAPTGSPPGIAGLFARFAASQRRPARIASQPPGSIPDTVLRLWLERMGVNPAHIQVLGMGVDQSQQALLAGVVDAAAVREPTFTLVQLHDPRTRVLAKGDDLIHNQPGSVLAVSEAALGSPDKAAAIATLVALHQRATQLLQSEPQRCAPHLQEGLGRGLIPLAIFQRVLASPATRFVADPMQIKDATAIMLEFQLAAGLLPARISLDTLLDAGFYQRAVAAR